MMKKKKTFFRKWMAWPTLILCAAIILGVTALVQLSTNRIAGDLSLADAQTLVDETLSALPNSVSTGALYIYSNTDVTVTDVEKGTARDFKLTCDYTCPNVAAVVEENAQKYVNDAYALYRQNADSGVKTNATKIKLAVAADLEADLSACETLSGTLVLEVFASDKGELTLYLSDETVNTLFGGLLDAIATVNALDTATYNGETISIATLNTLRTGIKDCIKLTNYDSTLPDTAIPLVKAWNSIKFDFYRNFIEGARWIYLWKGLLTTLEITACAVLLGIFIGFVVAIIRVTHQKTGKAAIADWICDTYVSIMRGTPVMVQLLIVYFVILLPIGVEKFPAAVLCFGLNSGAYVSEIVRGGILSIDAGQTEAGRSLGFNYLQTMYYIVIPQAFKAVLPSLANEFIALLKESSVAFYIGVADLTLGGLKIRSITYSNYMPLIAVAVIYLILVLGLSRLVGILERRLRKGDNR